MSLQWLSLVGAIWLQSVNGTNSNFPAYSSQLKRLLSISQLHLNNLASASDAGKLLCWISGVAAAHLPLWLVLLIGALLGLVGYGLQYLFFTHKIAAVSYWHIFILNALAGNGICWINTVCYIIAIGNFPLDRQIAVGLSTSYVGLSAKIYTNIVDVIVSPSSPSRRAESFLLLNALLPLTVCIVAAPLARDVHVRKTRNLSTGFLLMFVITTVTGLLAIVTSLPSVISRLVPNYVILAAMVLMLLLSLAVPATEKIKERLQDKYLIRVPDECFAGTVCTPSSKNRNNESDPENGCVEIEVVEEIGATEMVRRVEFWLYFFVYLFGLTLGLVYLNNLGQIAESRGSSATLSLVSLSSAFSFFGRLLPSLLDYIFPRNKCLITRAGAMGVMMAPMSGALFLLLNRHNMFLYISTAIISLCTGAITSISASTTTELFGTKNFGVNHNIVVSNIPIGSFLFGDFAAILYRRNGGDPSGAGNCIGQQCYQTTFIIWGFLCVFGVLLAWFLHKRTKKLYPFNRS